MTKEWLKPYEYKPGQSGNIKGWAGRSKEEKAMRKNFASAFAMLGTKTMAEILAIAKDPNQPAPFAIAAKCLEWAFKKGNPSMYREIFDRTMGKAVQQVELTGRDGEAIELSRPLRELPNDELIKLIPEAISTLKK